MAGWRTTGVEPQRVEHRYDVEDGNDSEPWVVAKPVGVSLKIPGKHGDDMLIGFNLRPGTSDEDALALSNLMNKLISDIELF
jgi:hypothetical protein